jgi:hypothetical protein
MDWEKDFRLEESNIGTLDAMSKKVPLNLQGASKLTLSGIENMDKETFAFGKSNSQSRAFRE